MITIKDSQLNLTQQFHCPDNFDSASFSKAMEAYHFQCDKTKETPIIEFIFEKVAKYIERMTFEEVKRKVCQDHGNQEGFTLRLAEEIAEISASEAVDRLSEGLYEEIIEMLTSQNLAFKTISMNVWTHDGIMNTPQVSVLDFFRIEDD